MARLWKGAMDADGIRDLWLAAHLGRRAIARYQSGLLLLQTEGASRSDIEFIKLKLHMAEQAHAEDLEELRRLTA